METNIVSEWGQNKVPKIQLRQKTASKILILLFPRNDSFPPVSTALVSIMYIYIYIYVYIRSFVLDVHRADNDLWR